MKYTPFYVSSFDNDSGLDLSKEPFLIPEKAFATLEDAYVWRGRVKRRQGFDFLGRLRRNLTLSALSGTISSGGAGDVTYNLFSNLTLSASETNPSVELGSITSISIGIAAPISQTLTDSAGTGTMTVVGAGSITAATINYATGVITMTFSGAAAASSATFTGAYYPSLPVMGLRTYEDSSLINDESLIAFDTVYAYQFSGGLFSELVTGTTWQGSDSDFFWTTNYYQNNNGDIFWATNFNAPGASSDPIRYYDSTAWTDFAPIINGANSLYQCLIILPFKDRLLAMNTFEGATLAGSTNYAQRIRFSQIGDPTDQVTGWLDDTEGKGGYFDLPTNEAIISAEYIKDVLLVKTERASWKVISTGDKSAPFIYQKINTELGAESTFSFIPFDKGAFTVGNYGITTDDSVNVFRIDQRIPDIVFNINNDNDGVKRVYGIRDYQQQLVYWTYPSSAQNPTFPNRVLVFNYINQTYSIFNDSFTCLGTFQRGSDLTWATLTYPSWSDWDDPWNSGLIQAKFPDIIAGNQQGYVEILNRQIFNDPSLYISGITAGPPAVVTSYNHNLESGRFVKISGLIGTTLSPDEIYKINVLTSDTFELLGVTASGTYLGGGEITALNNLNIVTKRFNPYWEVGSQVRLGYIDFFMEKTSVGELTVNLFVDENTTFPMNDPNFPTNSGVLGDNILLTRPENITQIPFQQFQQNIWHRLFFYMISQDFQLQFTFDDTQMMSEEINSEDVVLQGMVMYFSNNLRLIQ